VFLILSPSIIIDLFPFDRLYDTTIRLGQLQAHLKLPIDPEEFTVENLKFGLIEVVYE